MQSISSQAIIVTLESNILYLLETLSSLEIPELVKQGIVLLLLKRFDNSVQVALAHMAKYLLARVPDLDIDDLLSCLDSSCKLRVYAFTDKDHFNHG